MQVTMKELRSMIREAIEECGGGRYEYELEEGVSETQVHRAEAEGEGNPSGPVEELEEAWKELEEAAGLQEAAKKEEKKKEEKKPAKAAEKKEEKEDKSKYSVTAAQLRKMKDLNKKDFEHCLSLMKTRPAEVALRMCRAKED